MTLDVLHTELVGGGPGLVVLRVWGRAFGPAPCQLAPPALLIADAGGWRRLATVAGTPPLAAAPEGVPFAVDVEVPLHLAAAEGPWWLEPGLPLAGPGGPQAGADPAAVDALRVRIAALAAEVAALRAWVEADAASRRASPDAATAHGALDAAPSATTVAPADPAARSAPSTTVAPTDSTAGSAPSTTVAPADPAAPSATAIALPRPRLRALRPTLPAILFAAGALAAGDAVATVTWQEPLSAFWASRQQHALEDDLAHVDATLAARAMQSTGGTPIAALPDSRARMRTLAHTLERVTKTAKPLGQIRIPRLHVKYVIVQGTGAASLSRGPGHYYGTPLPGQPGTVGIAGHRTTYGAPFRHIDALKPGDPIDVTMPYGRFRYRVEGLRVVTPDDVSSLRDIGRPRLVLTACHPLYSAAKRLLVIARLERATPRGAAVASTPAPATVTPPVRPGGDAAAAPQRRA